MWKWNDGTELYHHGIKGQKWGQRNYQYEDGSLTPAGKQRYLVNAHGYGADTTMKRATMPHSRAKTVNNQQSAAKVQKGKVYRNTPISGTFHLDSSISAFTKANRDKLIGNIGKMVDQVYKDDSPYAKYYSKKEFSKDMERALSRYPVGGGVSSQEIIEDCVANVLKKANDKIELRQRAEAVENKRNPTKTYFMLKKGPGRM